MLSISGGLRIYGTHQQLSVSSQYYYTASSKSLYNVNWLPDTFIHALLALSESVPSSRSRRAENVNSFNNAVSKAGRARLVNRFHYSWGARIHLQYKELLSTCSTSCSTLQVNDLWLLISMLRPDGMGSLVRHLTSRRICIERADSLTEEPASTITWCAIDHFLTDFACIYDSGTAATQRAVPCSLLRHKIELIMELRRVGCPLGV